MSSSISNYNPFSWMSTVALTGVDISSNVFNFMCSNIRNVFNSNRERREAARQKETPDNQKYNKWKNELTGEGDEFHSAKIVFKVKQGEEITENQKRFLQEFMKNDKNKPHSKQKKPIHNIETYTLYKRIQKKREANGRTNKAPTTEENQKTTTKSFTKWVRSHFSTTKKEHANDLPQKNSLEMRNKKYTIMEDALKKFHAQNRIELGLD